MTARRLILQITVAAVLSAMTTGSATAAAAGANGTNGSTLRSAALLYRHGAISPKYNLPKVEVEWPMGMRQLTSVGKREMYEKGQELRRKYVDELGLVSKRFHASEIYARSSNTDRALQSAQMLMLGLYPPEIGARQAAPAPWHAFSAVPIHSVALKNDNVMRPWTGKTNCRRYLKFVKALPSTRLYGEQGRKYVHFLRRIASITGMNEGEKPAKILYEINEIYEPLSAIVQHRLPLPDGISENELTLMRALGDWNYHHQFLGRKIGRLTGGPFVEEVARNFRRVIEREDGARRLYVYSGHQRTILGVEAALGIETARTEGPLFLGRVPPLGSRYAFELHEVTGGAYAVRLVFVSGEGEQVIRIPGCDGLMCPFERFAAIVERVAPENWRGECGF